ncbi:hypothetical protein C8Q75DRAFT_205612 [Abortiporus biennis]|nr:hypothetical protein C8Q75DRAFT_205612 [Abortiporus biennis]
MAAGSRQKRNTDVEISSLTHLERLLFSQAVHEFGLDRLPDVAKLLTKHPLLSRPKNFFTQQSCTHIYESLMEAAGLQQSEDTAAPRSPTHLHLAQIHYNERINELRGLIAAEENKFKTLSTEIDEIRAGKWDSKILSDLGLSKQGLEQPTESQEVSLIGYEPLAADAESHQSPPSPQSPPSGTKPYVDYESDVEEIEEPEEISDGPVVHQMVLNDQQSELTVEVESTQDISVEQVGEIQSPVMVSHDTEVQPLEVEESNIPVSDTNKPLSPQPELENAVLKEDENVVMADEVPEEPVQDQESEDQHVNEEDNQHIQSIDKEEEHSVEPEIPEDSASPADEPSMLIEPESVSEEGVRNEEESLMGRNQGKRKASDAEDTLVNRMVKRPREDSQPVDEEEQVPNAPRRRRGTFASESQQAAKRFQNMIGMLHSSISQHRYGNIFHNPIKKSEAPDYHDIVKRPMDLKTIKSRVKDGLISNSLEFQRDVYLMFANAMMYNRPGSEIYNMAEEMMVESETQINTFRQTEGFHRS